MTQLIRKFMPQILGAIAMIAVVHAFMMWFEVPNPHAWFLGAVIYAGLVAVLFDKGSFIDKLIVYFVFIVVTVVGAYTVCPCTGGHIIIALPVGVFLLALLQAIK